MATLSYSRAALVSYIHQAEAGLKFSMKHLSDHVLPQPDLCESIISSYGHD